MSKIKKYDELSSDLEKLEPDVEKLKGEYQIEEILDIFMDPDKIPVMEASGAIGINTDLSVKEVKRGDYIWITALLRKPGQSFTSPAIQGIIKLRVVDMYYGLQYLNKVINQ